MKKRRFFALFLVLGLLVSLLSVPASAFEEIDVDARAALLVEKETGEILYEKNAHEKNYPASITKLTVALLVFEAIDAGQLSLDQPITAHESAFEGLSIYGSTAGIKVGEVLTVEQLLQCMLIVSANEACNILAEAVCGEGNISQFVQRMNERAAALGCENTHYVNTSGLHDPDHYTTAWDIYLITRALMPYEKFMEICNSKSAEIAETDHNQRHVLHSTNRLISNWRELGYLYRDAQGIKTGSTEEAGHCLVSSAVRGDRQLVSVVLGAEKITLADGKSTLTKSFSETIRLFDYGFDSFSRREVVSADELVREVPVALSSEANYVVAHPAESITRMLPTELDLSELTRGIARGLGVTGYVTSPTFTILQVHEEGRLPLYHFDWYRLESAEELYELAMDEYLQNGGVAVVEWPCRAPEAVPACRLEVEITPLGDTDRALRFTPVGGFRELDWEGWIS